MQRKQTKLAAKLLEQSELSPAAFPAVVAELQLSAVRYYASGQDWDLRQLLDVLSEEWEGVACLLTELMMRCKGVDRSGEGRNALGSLRDADNKGISAFGNPNSSVYLGGYSGDTARTRVPVPFRLFQSAGPRGFALPTAPLHYPLHLH